MKIYIAGPMRRVKDRNRENFFIVDRELQSRGHEVFNPIRADDEAGLSELADEDITPEIIRELRRRDDAVIETCDCLVVLPLWRCSKGATHEVNLAHYLGIPVFDVEGFRLRSDADRDAGLLHDYKLGPYKDLMGGRTGGWPSRSFSDFEAEFKTHANFVEASNLVEKYCQSHPAMVVGNKCWFFGTGPLGDFNNEELTELFTENTDGNKEADTGKDALTEGCKYDDGKAAFDLIPPEALRELAELYAIGAKKYEPRNWEKGFRWGRAYAALQRHANAWWAGESRCPENHQHHLASVIWNAITLREFERRGIGTDDRTARPEAAPEVEGVCF